MDREAAAHSYLGDDLHSIQGGILLCDTQVHNIPILALRDVVLFPGANQCLRRWPFDPFIDFQIDFQIVREKIQQLNALFR